MVQVIGLAGEQYSVLSKKETFPEHKLESDNILKVKLQKYNPCPLLNLFLLMLGE